MLTQIAKRLTKTAMSESDLLKFSDHLIAKALFPDDVRSTMASNLYTNGQSLLDSWRTEMKGAIAQIAAEKTWVMQRQRLIHFRVVATTWIALYEAVGVEPSIPLDISLWRSHVEGIGDFAANPESAWPTLLWKYFWFAATQSAVLCPLGMACYAIGDKLERHLAMLRAFRKHVIEKSVLLDLYIKNIDGFDPNLANSLLTVRKGVILIHYQNLFGFLRDLEDRIETKSVQENLIMERWTELHNGLNEQICALVAESATPLVPFEKSS